jgi:hypothetical protein
VGRLWKAGAKPGDMPVEGQRKSLRIGCGKSGDKPEENPVRTLGKSSGKAVHSR